MRCNDNCCWPSQMGALTDPSLPCKLRLLRIETIFFHLSLLFSLFLPLRHLPVVHLGPNEKHCLCLWIWRVLGGGEMKTTMKRQWVFAPVLHRNLSNLIESRTPPAALLVFVRCCLCCMMVWHEAAWDSWRRSAGDRWWWWSEKGRWDPWLLLMRFLC